MQSIEQRVKSQFAKCFTQRDCHLFKRMAEYYLRCAATLRTVDIKTDPALRLLTRNTQKRLFIGIGVELLLKAVYLKRGYAINRLKDDAPVKGRFPFRLDAVTHTDFDVNNTHTLNDVLQSLHRVIDLKALNSIKDGLRIAKVFRNKEGHVVVSQHRFEPRDYRAIESALVEIYARGFGQNLRVRFSIARGEKSAWKVT